MCQALNSIDEHCTQSSPSLRLPPRYKALNTFIDDLFAFIIKMPTLHRMSCFRDDIVFAVFLYQRWVYRVDKSRRNEFGHSFEGDDASAADAAGGKSGEGAKRSFLQQAQLRSVCKKITNYIRVVDYIVLSTLHQLLMSSLGDLQYLFDSVTPGYVEPKKEDEGEEDVTRETRERGRLTPRRSTERRYEGQQMLVEAVAEKQRALVVLDDPWMPEQVRLLNPIDGSQAEHRLLVTTRIRDLVSDWTQLVAG